MRSPASIFAAVCTLSFSWAASLMAQNVGIGVAAPLDRLHVAGNVRVDGLAGTSTRVVGANTAGTLTIVAAGTNGQVLTQTAGGPAWQNTSDWALGGNAGTNATTNFIGTTDGVDFVTRTSSVERVRVTAAGLMGVGTNAPNVRLHVNGDIRTGLVFPINTGTLPSFGTRIFFSGANSGATFDGENSDPLWMARYNAGSDATELRVNLSDNCSSVDAFVVQTGGSGCAANSELFRMDGTGAAYKPGGGSWAALSDQRLKHNVQPFTDGLQVVQQIRPVTYQYNGLNNTADNGIIHVGVIAQELQHVAPYMVSPLGDYLSVDPSAMNYILINAVKEQQAQIEELKARESTQEEQLKKMQAELERLAKVLRQ